MQLGKNIHNLRKQQGLSQENLAEKINVTRQTISNWELGETSPNPEQLILLSRTLNKSIDELVGNEINPAACHPDNSAKPPKSIALCLAVICGSAAGIWSFSANRFRIDEILLITFLGIIIGCCLGVLCHSILHYWKNNGN